MKENLNRPIAYGRTAEVYEWHDGKVLKLFHDWFPLDDIQYELRIARAVQTSGLPVPGAHDIVRVNGRNGLIYQRVDGVSMLEMTLRKPWRVFYYAGRMAELHADMHARVIQADIPNLHKKLAYKIRRAKALPAELGAKMSALLEKMPQGDSLCHGDFHPANILITKQGETIIDWTDAALGNPLADIARTSIILLGYTESGQSGNPFLKLFVRVFHDAYIRRYFSIRTGGENEFSLWLPIIAAARLSENIVELEDWLVARVGKGL